MRDCPGKDSRTQWRRGSADRMVHIDPSSERLDRINEELSIIQRRGGLTFGTDAYLLSAMAKTRPRARALDLGCGAGAISLLCAKREKYSSITAVELQPEYADLAGRNAEMNGLSSKMHVICRDVRELTLGDIGGEVDAVLMNPPYMTADSGRHNESAELSAARRELNGTVFDFCLAAGRLLRTGGELYAVFLPERLPDLISAMRGAGIEPKVLVTVYPDTESEPSLILMSGRRAGAPGMTYSRPLIIYRDGTREYTDDMERVYAEFSLSHITDRRRR